MARLEEPDVRKDKTRWRIAVWAGAAAAMALPVLTMRAMGGAAGDPGDFVFLGLLVAGVWVAYEVAARVPARRAYFTAACLAFAAGLLQMWINLAVGVIGSEDNAANLIYGAVIAVALVGSALGRFRPLGMSYAMLATAIAQGLAFVFALWSGWGFTGPITVFFVALWLISAWLFRNASEDLAGAARTAA